MEVIFSYNRELELLDISPSVERVLGYTPEELISGVVPYPSIVHPEDLGRVADEVAAHTESGVENFAQEYMRPWQMQIGRY